MNLVVLSLLDIRGSRNVILDLQGMVVKKGIFFYNVLSLKAGQGKSVRIDRKSRTIEDLFSLAK
jgi:hypothetical protein